MMGNSRLPSSRRIGIYAVATGGGTAPVGTSLEAVIGVLRVMCPWRSLFLLALLMACGSQPTTGPATRPQWKPSAAVAPTTTQPSELELPPSSVSISVEAQPLAENAGTCSGRFVLHELDHITTVPGGNQVRMFEANGCGVAINDLDNDGDLDILLANHADPNTILWNEGSLRFRTERLGEGFARAANIVDVDGDGWLDIVLTRRSSAPNYWRNEGGQRFTRILLAGIDKPLYALNWADLDGDNDLDFVGGTYDADLLVLLGIEFLTSGKGGVFAFENQVGRYATTRLAGEAHALTILLPDLNEDGRPDIIVGNDFARLDYTWWQGDDGWLEKPFDTTSHSTMSLDLGDVDNDGAFEIFSTDMAPFDDDLAVEDAWRPVMDDMMADPHPRDDPQIMSNVFQIHTGVAGYQNAARPRGIDATGWTWSAKFGDLDQDGWLDLYAVNGFIATSTFPHLPNHELIEENQALRNAGRGYFEAMPEWGLGSTRSGRGMSLADLDGDGDLDIVINNLRGPAQLYENQLCTGASLQVDLFWPGSGNARGIGAVLALHTGQDSYYRPVKAASGYLSGDPARIHFGFPQDTELHWLEVRWPDGAISVIEELQAGTMVSIRRE